MYAAPRVEQLLGQAALEPLPAEPLPLEDDVQPAARSVEEEE